MKWTTLSNGINLNEVIVDEIALEGLDGITLEALWQRIALRLGETLPLKVSFMEQIWKISLESPDLSFHELEVPRNNLIIYDLYELEYLNAGADKDFQQRDIYLHCPVEDEKNSIRGSCATYHTRKNVTDTVKSLTLNNVLEKYGQKLVIVASQILRERALIPDDVNPTLELPLSHYCLLERIGRTRKMGEITIKKSNSIKEDARTLFYLRKNLQQYGLIRMQKYYQGNFKGSYNGLNIGTLVHLTRFYNTRKPKVIMWAEHLINYLKTKEKYAAEYNEVKTELNLDYSIKKFFKIQLLQKLFRTDVKVPYRSYYPNSVEKDWQVKNGTGKERIIKLVTLSDEKIEINDIWRTEEVDETEETVEQKQLDAKNQKINTFFLRQIYNCVESKEYTGASQTDLAAELGVTKLVGRTLMRNLVKCKIVSTYLDDVGRQRTTKFVSKKFHAQSSIRKQFDSEISKIKEFSQSVKNAEAEENVSSDQIVSADPENGTLIDLFQEQNQTNDDLPLQLETEKLENISSELKVEMKDLSLKLEKEEKDLLEKNNKLKDQTYALVNRIFCKYKLFKNRNRFLRYSKDPVEISKLKNSSNYCRDNNRTKLNNFSNRALNQKASKYKSIQLKDSNFYKTVETSLIVQKPECKKKSQKVAVVGLLNSFENSNNLKNSGVSYRLLRRANLVIASVREHKIIEDIHKLMKFIHAEEDKEGIEVKIDKNSLLRLLQKLEEDNLIKYIKLILKNKKQTKHTKVINFICDPSIDENDPLLQSAVEQAKLKFSMQETGLQRSNAEETNEKSIDLSRRIAEDNMILERDNRLGKKYGYSPKFIRIKTMHVYLYYLIYDHSKTCIPKSELLETLKQDGLFFDSLEDDDINFYRKEVDWKMFVSPLPKHKGYPYGWALMRDILLRIPLSIFVKVNNINYEVPGLQEYLNHPVKQHLPVKNLPPFIRNKLYYKRKYMFNIHEIVMKLCYLGLAQFGEQLLKEKDQVFMYLNKHTELLDTTSSAAGYHKIEDKPYPVTKYTFSSMDIVENYWYDVWNTCINTCLGGRSIVEGKDILLEDLSKKIEMIQALKVKQPEEAVKCDTGFVPGDRKGAAGIDSAFFPHLKRNWNWINADQKSIIKKENHIDIQSEKGVTKSSSGVKKLPMKRKSTFPKQSLSRISMTVGTRFVDSAKTSSKQKKNQPNFSFPTISCSKPPKIIRKVLPRKPMRKRVKYDEIDFSALQRMDKLRVDWEQHEDNILLVCKVAMVYLCPNPRRNLVSYTAIRDILRSYSFTSYNKTSRACQRRLSYMLKQSKTINSVVLGVEEVKQDYFVNKRFGGLVDSMRSESEDQDEHEKKIEKVFKELVMYIAKKYYNISNMEQREAIALPKTIQEFNIYHNLKLPTKTIKSPGISKEVHEINDIHTTTINSVIHSSMCCGKERRSWAYQLFKVYQQYPEYLLRSAMLKIRADQMVTMKKNYMCAQKKFGNCMPMSSSQYQLSSAYYFKFQTKWPYEVFSESYDALLSLFHDYVERMQKGTSEGVELKSGIGGIIAMMHDFVGTDNLIVEPNIPDQIIMLDPGLQNCEKDEVYQRIALRYQTILDNLNSDYTEQLKLRDCTLNQEEDQNKQVDLVTTPDIQDVRTRQTRIAMLKMREELHDLTLHDSHHAHEYFVVNSFKLNYSLTANEEEKQNLTFYQSMEVPKSFLPIDIDAANTVLESVKRDAIFPKNILPLDSLKEEILKANIFDWDDVKTVYNFIKSKAEFGVTLYELTTNFGQLENQLAEILSLLSENRLVLRAGIVAVRYIHHRFINPWIIHSYKILRLEKESHQTLPEGSVYVLDNEDDMLAKEQETKRVTTAANLFYSQPIKSTNIIKRSADLEIGPPQKKMKKNPEQMTIDLSECETEKKNTEETESDNLMDISYENKISDDNNENLEEIDLEKSDLMETDDTDDKNSKRIRRNRTVLLKQKDIFRAAKLLDFNSAEEIKVVIKPWIRIDGVLNRRVLDRMLGAILCYCIERPGIALSSVQNRFTPAIQPYHTRELIEILVKLGCIKTAVQRTSKVTLFSKSMKLDLVGNPDLEANSDSIILEPSVQATLKFGIFLSNRSYNSDFLSSL